MNRFPTLQFPNIFKTIITVSSGQREEEHDHDTNREGLISQNILKKPHQFHFPLRRPPHQQEEWGRQTGPSSQNQKIHRWFGLGCKNVLTSSRRAMMHWDDGDMELQQQILNTLAWRNEWIFLIQTLLSALNAKGFSSGGMWWKLVSNKKKKKNTARLQKEAWPL